VGAALLDRRRADLHHSIGDLGQVRRSRSQGVDEFLSLAVGPSGLEGSVDDVHRGLATGHQARVGHRDLRFSPK